MICAQCYATLPAGSKYCLYCQSESLIATDSDAELSFDDLSFDPPGSVAAGSRGGSQAQTSYLSGTEATRLYRFGGLMLDFALNFLTLGVGWFVWFLFIAGRGQTPAKQLLRMQVVRESTGTPGFAATFWRYYIPNALNWLSLPFTVLGFFSLPFALATLISIISTIAYLLPLTDALFIFTKRRKRLVDIMFRTRVVRV